MKPHKKAEDFLSQYDAEIMKKAFALRDVVIASLPGVAEQLDIPAKMVAYCYGQKYVDLICMIIPSKKGLKLGFNRGAELPDPQGWLQGTGKISRYVEIKSGDQILSSILKDLLEEALKLYHQKIKYVK